MALRDPQAKLATFTRAGVLCVGPSARACVAHGLPSTPDIFSWQPIAGSGAAGASILQVFVESWDATSIVFVNSLATGIRGYMTAQVVHSIQQ